MTSQGMRAQAPPTLLMEHTLRDRAAREFAFRIRQALGFCSAVVGRGRKPAPLLLLTTSRSGSTWLCELLFGVNQSGPLPEHLRPQHFEYALHATDGRSRLRDWLGEAAELIRSRRDGGSKLIWDYFPELFPGEDAGASSSVLAPLLDLTPVCLRLRREDIVAQAVSRFRSSRTGVYHRHRRDQRLQLVAEDRAQAATAATPTYDAAAIAHHEDVLRRAESHLDAVIAALGLTVHEVVYEDLIVNASTVLSTVAATLRPDLAPDGQLRRVQRALDRALILKSDDAQQSEWLRRYRAERAK